MSSVVAAASNLYLSCTLSWPLISTCDYVLSDGSWILRVHVIESDLASIRRRSIGGPLGSFREFHRVPITLADVADPSTHQSRL